MTEHTEHTKTTQARLRLLAAALAVSASLSGCAQWKQYQPIGPGGDTALWRPDGTPADNFDLQIARKADLVQGRGDTSSAGRPAADAIDRMRRGHPTPLPESSISRIGSPSPGGP